MPKYKKRADGRYATTIPTGKFRKDGSPILRTIYAKTIKALEDKLSEYRVQAMTGLRVFEASMTFGDYAEQWFVTHKATRSIQTRNMYRNILDVHIDLLADLPLDKITGTHIQAQVNTAADKPRIAELILLTCNQIFKSAINDRLLTFNPCGDINLPRKIKKEKRAFTEAEKRAIKAADFNEQEKALVMILYTCGLRPAEAYALTWSDIDFRDEVITVCKSLNFDGEKPVLAPPKTNHSIRTIEMHRSLIQPLKEYKRKSNQLLLFGVSDGRYMTKSNYQTLFAHCKAKIVEALGHDTEITAYYFRHNFCTQLYYSGVSMKEAVRLMGHEDSSMIMKIYAHLDSTKENTRNKINAINF